MKKQYYSKLKKLFKGCKKVYLQAVNNDVFITEGHVLVRMPDWMYNAEFLEPDVYPGFFPVISEGECLIVVNGYDIKEDGPDIRAFWQKCWNESEKYLVRSAGDKFRHWDNDWWYVRFLETETDRVLVNNKFYEAVEQAARDGLMYGSTRRQPVWFFDRVELSQACLAAFVLPILYND